MKNITKEVFLNTVACPTLGWIMVSEEEGEILFGQPLSLAEQFRMEQGLEVQNRVRKLHPDGILVDRRDNETAMRETAELMRNPDVSTIFEATFSSDGYVTKTDILERKDTGWHMSEIKSGASNKPEYIDDMAYTTMVARKAGCDISAVSLIIVSKDYRLGMSDAALFISEDCSEKVFELREEFISHYYDDVQRILGLAVKPSPVLRRECKGCPMFGECEGKDVEYHILEIPRLSQKKFDLLQEQRIACIEDIPDGMELTDNQARIRSCVISQQPFISAQLETALSAIVWPPFYLDFETVMTAIPLYPDIAPYTQLPTQYSVHKSSGIGPAIEHREYLADPSKDCRRELAERLIDDLENEGSIIVYSSFEKTTISRLKRDFPDLAKRLDVLAERLYDLEVIFKNHFCHPGFHGRTSIKVTLPTLVPELSYSDLEIADGDSASAAFAYLALGRYSEGDETEDMRNKLLRYCERDTLAMVKLHEKLAEYIA